MDCMADQKRHYDLVIIGTGSAASAVAFRCRAAGWRVAVIDSRPFGGTCALRGCHPKDAGERGRSDRRDGADVRQGGAHVKRDH